MRVYQIALLAAAVLLATASATTESKQTKVTKVIMPEIPFWERLLAAEQNAKRFLRTEKTNIKEEEETEHEERVWPGTAAAKKMILKLEKVVNTNQLVKQKEPAQFALWFITGRGPSYVAEHILKVDPVHTTDKVVFTGAMSPGFGSTLIWAQSGSTSDAVVGCTSMSV